MCYFNHPIIKGQSHMLMGDLFIVLLLCLIPYIWWIDRGIKQYAFVLAADYCKQQDIVLLDDTVQQTQFTVKRDDNGNVKIRRSFMFEFASTGERRYTATFELVNKKIHNMTLDAYQI
jgi:hypothetical protein